MVTRRPRVSSRRQAVQITSTSGGLDNARQTGTPQTLQASSREEVWGTESSRIDIQTSFRAITLRFFNRRHLYPLVSDKVTF